MSDAQPPFDDSGDVEERGDKGAGKRLAHQLAQVLAGELLARRQLREAARQSQVGRGG